MLQSREPRSFKDTVLDTFYWFFEPIRVIYRDSLGRTYRVTWTYDGGMTLMEGEKTFTAFHDREARRLARKISGREYFELEHVRKIKL